jgi:hypothetical protein
MKADEFQFRSEPWDGRLTWSDYRERLRREFEKEVAEYGRLIRRTAEANNFIRAPARYCACPLG